MYDNSLTELFHRQCQRVDVDKGVVIYNSQRDENNTCCYYLESGWCAMSSITSSGEERSILYMGEKRIINFLALLPSLDFERIKEALTPMLLTTKTPCVIYKITPSFFLELLRDDPRFSDYLLKALSENFIDLLRHFHSSQDDCATVRLCSLLLKYAEVQTAGLTMPEWFNYGEMSRYLGIHIVTVSRIMAQLKQRGLVEKHGRRIILTKPDEIKKVIAEKKNFDF